MPNNYLFDAHCHIQNSATTEDEKKVCSITRNDKILPEDYTQRLVKRLENLSVNGVAMMGTTIYDSQRISKINSILIHSQINENNEKKNNENENEKKCYFYGVGIHPWYCESTLAKEFDWKMELETLVKENPKVCLGECGLDKVAKSPITKKLYSMNTQNDFFDYQFHLAVKYQRPIIIHAVRTTGKLFERLKTLSQALSSTATSKRKQKKAKEKAKNNKQEEKEKNDSYNNNVNMDDENEKKSEKKVCPEDILPLRIMFHSYSGSPEMTKSLLQLPKEVSERFYFGFSYFVNSRIVDTTRENIKLIPRDKIMLETDHQEMDSVVEYLDEINRLLLPSLEGVNNETEFYKLTNENARRFFTF